MKNIRLFFDEVYRVIMDEKNYYPDTSYKYRSVGNVEYRVYVDCRDEIFYKLSTMLPDARKIYALAILKELEVALSFDYIDKTEKIEVVKITNSESGSFRTISKAEADKSGIIGEYYSETIHLHEYKNQHIVIDCLISDIDCFINDVKEIFEMFSIDLKTIAIDNSIDIEQITEDRSYCFQINLTQQQKVVLFNLLVANNFISQNIKEEDFINAISGNVSGDSDFKITWLKNKQLLRELLTPLRCNEIIQADFERSVPLLFKNDKNTPIKLAKNKPILSQDSDKIAEILKKLATC